MSKLHNSIAENGIPSSDNRKLAAILFADIVGYTALMQKDERTASTILKRFQNEMELQVAQYKGQIINFYGDGALCTFQNPLEAMRCAMDIQLACKNDPKIPLRIGIHSGTVVIEGDKIYGDSVNLTSRIESMGVSGAILFSKQVRDEIKNQPDLQITPLGNFDFKNVEESMEIFALANDGFVVPKPEEMKGKGRKMTANATFKQMILGIGAIGVFFFAYHQFFNTKIKVATPVLTTETIRTAPIENTIAVLPLINLNQATENLDYFSDGVTQEIIDELAKVSAFKVCAFTQSVFYKNKNKSPKEIAEELNVQYLVSGSSRVFKDGKMVKLSIELFNPYNNERIWNSTIEESMMDAHTLQLAIAKHVVSSLNVNLSKAEIASLETTTTSNGEAFRLFLQAKSELNKFTEEGFNRSREILHQAIAIDSNYAHAYTLLAWSLTLSGDPQLVSDPIPIKENEVLVLANLNKSLAINPKSSDAYLVKSAFNLYNKNLIADAKKDLDIALQLKSWPRIPTNYCTCTIVSVYNTMQDVAKAKAAAELAKEIDPGNLLLAWDMANIFMIEGDYKAAQALYQEAVDADENPYFYVYLGWSFFHDEQYEIALQHLEKAYKTYSLPIAMNTAYLSNTYYQLGDLEKADYYLTELKNRATKGEPQINLNLATIYAARNDISQTLSYVEKAFEQKEYAIAVMTSLDPVFRKIYDEPRFMEIRRQMQYYQ